MPRFKNILFPTDFSACADHAKQYAFALAKESGGKVHIVHVVDAVHLAHLALDGVYTSSVAVDSTGDSRRRRFGSVC